MLSRLALVGLTVVAASGCHSLSPRCNTCGSEPYQPMPQSQAYPPATIVPHQSHPSVPDLGETGQPSYQPPVQSSPSHHSHGAGDLVPEKGYDDPPESEADPQFNTEPEDLSSAVQPSGVELQQIDDGDLGASVAPTEIAGEESAEQDFSPPVPFQPTSNTRTIGEADAPSKPARLNPYLYDKDNDDDFNKDGIAEAYEWLRGVVDYDEKDETWQITYNPDPTDKEDKYRGTFTLSNAEILYKQGLVPGDVVLLDGRVDVENPDKNGKPTYRVEKGDRIEPDPNYASTDN